MNFMLYAPLNGVMRRAISVGAKSIFTQMAVAAFFLANTCHALLIYGLRWEPSGDQYIVSFLANSPGTLLSDRLVNGIGSGENLVGLTFDPDNGMLYSIGQTAGGGRLLSVNPYNGRVTQIGTSGPEFLFADNISLYPRDTGRIRVFSDIIDGSFIVGQKNFLVNRFTGAALRATNNLAYIAGDPAFGAVPRVNALAFTNPHSDSIVSTLFGIDTSRDTLVRVGDVNQGGEASLNGGDVTTIGALGVNFVFASMAIAPRTNIAYATNQTGGVTTLYRINLSTGAATAVGAVGSPSVSTSLSAIAIRDDSKCFDLDGNGRVETTSDGLMLLRALLGFNGASVPENAIPPGPHPIDSVPLRTSWTAIRGHLNTNCGMDFAP